MAKTLLERVSEEAQKRAVAPQGKTTAFIQANRAEIQSTLDHGHDVKIIWQVLKKDGRIDCNYPYFWKLLKKHFPGHFTPKIKLPGARPGFAKTPPPSPAVKKPEVATIGSGAGQPEVTGMNAPHSGRNAGSNNLTAGGTAPTQVAASAGGSPESAGVAGGNVPTHETDEEIEEVRLFVERGEKTDEKPRKFVWNSVPREEDVY